jgi:hypothetical protein
MCGTHLNFILLYGGLGLWILQKLLIDHYVLRIYTLILDITS